MADIFLRMASTPFGIIFISVIPALVVSLSAQSYFQNVPDYVGMLLYICIAVINMGLYATLSKRRDDMALYVALYLHKLTLEPELSKRRFIGRPRRWF